MFTGVEAPRSIQTHCGVSPMEIWKGSREETADERMKARGMMRADIVDSRKTAHARCTRSEGFPLAFPLAIVRTLVSQGSLNYFALFEPGQRSRAIRRPLHKVGSVRVNETPLQHLFIAWLAEACYGLC